MEIIDRWLSSEEKRAILVTRSFTKYEFIIIKTETIIIMYQNYPREPMMNFRQININIQDLYDFINNRILYPNYNYQSYSSGLIEDWLIEEGMDYYNRWRLKRNIQGQLKKYCQCVKLDVPYCIDVEIPKKPIYFH